MQFKSIHMKDRPWEYFQDRNSFPLRRKDLLNFETCGCTEFVYGYAELQPGETIPLHLNRQAECDFILSGRAWVRLGKRKVEIREKTGIYFPSGYPHSYEVIGKEPLRFFYAFATEKYGQEIGFEFASEKSANSIDIVNMWKQRWAVVDDFEPWQLWEPSKGFWGMSWKTLFDAELGNWVLLR